jgi:NitT/TauT family transport system ATP-binding protein
MQLTSDAGESPPPLGGSAVSMPVEPVVVAQGVGKVFPNGVAALAGVSLVVRQGEFVTLLGPSGCGKSTLLRLIAGLASPSSGVVDRSGGAETPIGFVFQQPTLMPWTTIRVNVRLPLDLAGIPRRLAAGRVDAALHLVGLAEFAAAYPRQLSGGMRMRASIARALVTEPALLLMDEPFGALDEITRGRMDTELRELWWRRRLTVVFVTHSITEAVLLSTRVVVMSARPGRIVGELAIDEGHPRGEEFRLGRRFAILARRLSALLAQGEAGVQVEPGVPAEPGLPAAPRGRR